MYTIIKATEKHIDQIVKHTVTTGYFLATAKYNILNISAFSFIRKYVVKSALHLTNILIDNEFPDKVLGVVSCGAKSQIEDIPSFDHYRHPEIREMLKNFIEFQIPGGYYIQTLTVLKELRGNSLGRMLLNFAEIKAVNAGCTRMSLLVWGCQISAIKLYLSTGMVLTESIFVSSKFKYNELLLFEKHFSGYIPKKTMEVKKYIEESSLLESNNYFESDEYLNLDIIDICPKKN